MVSLSFVFCTAEMATKSEVRRANNMKIMAINGFWPNFVLHVVLWSWRFLASETSNARTALVGPRTALGGRTAPVCARAAPVSFRTALGGARTAPVGAGKAMVGARTALVGA